MNMTYDTKRKLNVYWIKNQKPVIDFQTISLGEMPLNELFSVEINIKQTIFQS